MARVLLVRCRFILTKYTECTAERITENKRRWKYYNMLKCVSHYVTWQDNSFVTGIWG
jgi:hypothetical protein